jgi:hypothetical protein
VYDSGPTHSHHSSIQTRVCPKKAILLNCEERRLQKKPILQRKGIWALEGTWDEKKIRE